MLTRTFLDLNELLTRTGFKLDEDSDMRLAARYTLEILTGVPALTAEVDTLADTVTLRRAGAPSWEAPTGTWGGYPSSLDRKREES